MTINTTTAPSRLSSMLAAIRETETAPGQRIRDSPFSPQEARLVGAAREPPPVVLHPMPVALLEAARSPLLRRLLCRIEQHAHVVYCFGLLGECDANDRPRTCPAKRVASLRPCLSSTDARP